MTHLSTEASAKVGPSIHPNLTFRITGYRGTKQDNLHIFPDGSFEDVKQAYPVGSEHAHVPPPPCQYEMVFAGERDMLEERRQLFCSRCYPATVPEDNRKAPAA